MLQKRSTLLFLGGYKQLSDLVSSSSCVEEGILTINFFTTTAYSEVVLLMFYMAQQAKRKLCCFKLNNCKHSAAVSSEYGGLWKSKAAV